MPTPQFIDRAHRRPLPTGSQMAGMLKFLMPHVGAAALKQAKERGYVDLRPWAQSLTDPVMSYLSVYFKEGQRATARRILRQVYDLTHTGRIKSFRNIVTKELTGTQGLEYGWDLYMPETDEFIRRATYDFVQSTMATATKEANEAIAEVRAELISGMRQGDGVQGLNERFFKIFNDPYKAARIAQTESSRAVHAANLMVSKAVGVTHKRVLASSDACEKCLTVASRGWIPIDDPFFVEKKPGPYQIVMAPPIHVGCMCTTQEQIDPDAITEQMMERVRLLAK